MSRSASRYIIEPCGRGFDVSDDDGVVASFGEHTDDDIWWVVAETNRFKTTASLPAAFDGYFHHRLASRADVLRMFGLMPPSAPAAASLTLELKAA